MGCKHSTPVVSAESKADSDPTESSSPEGENGRQEEKFAKYWPRNIIILLGPPAAGKGTHGPKIEAELGVPQLSTGDMLRAAVAAQTEVGLKARDMMQRGMLVPDEIIVKIVKDRIQEDDCRLGFILDGFPRTLQQAQSLDAILAQEGSAVSKVIELQLPDAVLEERICGRWIHKESGRSYHVEYSPPKSMQKDADGQPIPESMLDDETLEPLMQRPDDTPGALVKRLAAYHHETVPILKHYRPLGVVRTIDANQGMEDVWLEVETALGRAVMVEPPKTIEEDPTPLEVVQPSYSSSVDFNCCAATPW